MNNDNTTLRGKHYYEDDQLYLDKFKCLPHLTFDDNDELTIVVDEDDEDTDGYIPNLCYDEGEWHVEWISHDGDTALGFVASSAEKAIMKAYNYYLKIKADNHDKK